MTTVLKSKWSALDEMRSIALEGLHYATDPYDVTRYEKLRDLVEQEYAELTGLSNEKIKSLVEKEMGIQTPKVGVGGVVFNADHQMLILKRTDDLTWCHPCGWIDVGESPREAMIRELKEETDLNLEPKACIGVGTHGPGRSNHLVHQVGIRFVLFTEDTSEVKISHEHTDYNWITENQIKDYTWHGGHDDLARKGLNFLKVPEFDQSSLF